ncbi:MAG: peptide/nickel transport system ATP-binding protein [Thermomicrobiales bacterium]|nr:peptide/nickel transport system ATP-binding protein [Thermomicrobiales bacterium]
MTSLLRVESLKKYYPIRTGLFARRMLHAVDDVSLELTQGETVGLVGESGSGKSTVGKCVTMLEAPTDGKVTFANQRLETMSFDQLRSVRRSLQMVFQDPYDSLNPRRTAGETVLEPLTIHGIAKGAAARERTAELFERVGLKPEHMARFPHQLSGGQQQRVGIARALATEPSLIVLDEPTSALDVSVQAKLIRLLRGLQREKNLTYLFISHDLSVVGYLSDRVAVMYLGQIVEIGRTRQIFSEPRHPYTMALMSAIPAANPLERRERIILKGEIPSPIEPPSYCRLASRCPFATDECRSTKMELWEVAPGRRVACIRSVRGEIPIPHYDLGGQAVTIAKPDQRDELAAIADEAVAAVRDD